MNPEGLTAHCPLDMLEASQKVIMVIRRFETILTILFVLPKVDEPFPTDPETVMLLVTKPGWVMKD